MNISTINIHIVKCDKYNFINGNLSKSYDETKVKNYMKNSLIEISIDIGLGNKNFTAYTMDLTKRYIEINADYRS